ncbi:MAG: serine dehydratase subunit alpha family protein [Mangrovibacterium sp.]
MMTRSEINDILALMKQEIVPAIGCTEPVAVALAIAKAKEVLGEDVQTVELHLSQNILKNALGVGIPGTGMIGLPIAVALGVVIGKSEYQLEVLKDLTPEGLAEAKQFIADKAINIRLKEDAPDKLYIEVRCAGENNEALAVICGSHSNITTVELNGESLQSDEQGADDEKVNLTVDLSFQKVYDFAQEVPLEELDFVVEAARVNSQAAEMSHGSEYGHTVGKTIEDDNFKYIMGDSIFNKIVSTTSAACDVRMAGAMIPVVSNSGSGNQGITCSLPVVVFAEHTQKTEEELARALAMSNLLVIYIKTKLGRLSALCGVTVAAMGASSAITMLMGGSCEQLTYSVKNMIANVTGMLCDGAKPSCAMKVSGAVSSAVYSAIMAMRNNVVTSAEGVADDCIEKTICNLSSIGGDGMSETDKMILNIMLKK